MSLPKTIEKLNKKRIFDLVNHGTSWLVNRGRYIEDGTCIWQTGKATIRFTVYYAESGDKVFDYTQPANSFDRKLENSDIIYKLLEDCSVLHYADSTAYYKDFPIEVTTEMVQYYTRLVDQSKLFLAMFTPEEIENFKSLVHFS
jgi:hypothetical protein